MVALENVTFSIQGTPLLNDISLRIEQGRSVMVMGESGSGKSLLMKIMAGIIPAHSGVVRLNGADIAHLSVRQINAMRNDFGFLFQDGALWQNMTVLQNLMLPLQTHRGKWTPHQMKERIDRLCAYLRFEDDLSQRPVSLSSGERKVVALMRALVLDPSLLFYDEPHAGLDSRSSERVLQLFKDQKAAGKTQVIASHNGEIASMVADSILVLDRGAVLAYDTVRNLTRTDDPRLKEILSGVLDLSSTYDSDILEILGSDDGNPFG